MPNEPSYAGLMSAAAPDQEGFWETLMGPAGQQARDTLRMFGAKPVAAQQLQAMQMNRAMGQAAAFDKMRGIPPETGFQNVLLGIMDQNAPVNPVSPAGVWKREAD